MVDVVSAQKRSEMMSGIRSKDTQPEYAVRRALHAEGYRYRLHVKDMPGKPDIVMRKYRAVILVHGCFWHGHDCHLFKWPGSRIEFWRKKILGNRENDEKTRLALLSLNWRIMVIWECAIKGKNRLEFAAVSGKVKKWLDSGRVCGEIRGRR